MLLVLTSLVLVVTAPSIVATLSIFASVCLLENLTLPWSEVTVASSRTLFEPRAGK